jgi:hypothetical protein
MSWPFTATACANSPAVMACSKAKNPAERAGSRWAGACFRRSSSAASCPGITSYREPVRHGRTRSVKALKVCSTLRACVECLGSSGQKGM